MFLIFLALNAIYVFAFNDFDFMKNGNAEERFSFDGYFDRIEHGYGGYHDDHHSKGNNYLVEKALKLPQRKYIIWGKKSFKNVEF